MRFASSDHASLDGDGRATQLRNFAIREIKRSNMAPQESGRGAPGFSIDSGPPPRGSAEARGEAAKLATGAKKGRRTLRRVSAELAPFGDAPPRSSDTMDLTSSAAPSSPPLTHALYSSIGQDASVRVPYDAPSFNDLTTAFHYDAQPRSRATYATSTLRRSDRAFGCPSRCTQWFHRVRLPRTTCGRFAHNTTLRGALAPMRQPGMRWRGGEERNVERQ